MGRARGSTVKDFNSVMGGRRGSGPASTSTVEFREVDLWQTMSWERLSFYLSLAERERERDAMSPMMQKLSEAAGGLTMRVVWDENRYLFARIGRAMGDGAEAWEPGGREETEDSGSWDVTNRAAHGGIPESAISELQAIFDAGGETARGHMREHAHKVSCQVFAAEFARHLRSSGDSPLRRLFITGEAEGLSAEQQMQVRAILRQVIERSRLEAAVRAAIDSAGDLENKPTVKELRQRIAKPVALALLASDN